jgi:hypothetical protein
LSIHDEYDHLYKILELIKNQTGINHSNVVVYIIDSSFNAQAQIESQLAKKYRMMRIQYHKVPINFYWSKMNFGIREISKISKKSDLVLFLNVDVEFEKTFFHDIFSLYSKEQDFILSACISEDYYAKLHCGVRIITRKFKVIDNLVLNDFYGDRYLTLQPTTVSTRSTVYPARIFHLGLRIRHALLPHYFADLVLGLEAQELGLDIKFHSAIQITNTRNPSVSKLSSNFFIRYFSKGSPTRLISILVFWMFVFKFEIKKFMKNYF